MAKVVVVISFLVFIFSAIHTLIFKGEFKDNLPLYFVLGIVLLILVMSGVISESHFEDLPSLIDGIGSIFGL